MTYSTKKIIIINLNNILLLVSNNLFNNDYIINNEYKLDNSVHHKKKSFIKKLIQHYLLIEFLNVIKQLKTNQKAVVLIQPYQDQGIELLRDSTGEIAYKIIVKFIKKTQQLLPLYFCFLDEYKSLININYVEDLINQKNLYYLLLEITNNNKKYNIKKLKGFLLKNGFKEILSDYFK